MATKGGSKLQMYPVMLGAAGTNSARQIAEHSAAGCVYVQLEGIKVQTGSRRATVGVLGSKHTSAGVDMPELDKQLAKHGIKRLAAKQNNTSDACTVLTERDARDETDGLVGETSYTLSFWAELGAAAAAQMLQRQQSVIIDAEPTAAAASRKAMYVQPVKCDGRAIAKIAYVAGIVTTNRGLVKHTAEELIRAYQATFRAAAEEHKAFLHTEQRILNIVNTIFDKDANGRYKHLAIQPERITTKTPGVVTMLKSLTGGELTHNNIRTLTATSYRYSVWMSREMYGIAEVSQLVETINTEKLFTFGPGDDKVANLQLEVDMTPRTAAAEEAGGRGGPEADGSEGMDMNDDNKAASTTPAKPKLQPCRTYYFFDPADAAVNRSAMAEQLGSVVKIALNPHAEGAVVDKLTEALYDNLYIDERADKYITILEQNVNKEMFVLTLKAAATMLSGPDKVIEVQTTAGRMVFLLITVPLGAESPSDGATSTMVLRELRRVFGDLLEAEWRQDSTTEAKRDEIKTVMQAYGFRPDRQQGADQEGLFTQRHRKALALRDATGKSTVGVLRKHCSACIEAKNVGIGFDIASPKKVTGCEWMAKAAHSRAIEVFQDLTGKPKDHVEGLLQIDNGEGSGPDYRLALTSGSGMEIVTKSEDSEQVVQLKQMVMALRNELATITRHSAGITVGARGGAGPGQGTGHGGASMRGGRASGQGGPGRAGGRFPMAPPIIATPTVEHAASKVGTTEPTPNQTVAETERTDGQSRQTTPYARTAGADVAELQKLTPRRGTPPAAQTPPQEHAHGQQAEAAASLFEPLPPKGPGKTDRTEGNARDDNGGTDSAEAANAETSSDGDSAGSVDDGFIPVTRTKGDRHRQRRNGVPGVPGPPQPAGATDSKQ